jgi:hypothetical protein
MGNSFFEIQETIFSSTNSTLTKIVAFWPNILGALGVLLIGWGVSVLVYNFIVKSSNKLKLGFISNKLNITHLLQKAEIKTPLSVIIARFLKAYIFTMFFIGAANIVQLRQIADFLESIIEYIPNVIIALIIVLFGIHISNTINSIVKGALHFSSESTANILSGVAKYSLIFFSILAALVKLNIANTLVEILFIGFVAMMALAGGLSLGLGGKDIAKELLDVVKQKELAHIKSKKKRT